MKEFFGIGGYTREPEGYLSWQHLLFVTSVMLVMALLAVLIGRKYKPLDEKRKNKVLLWAAILINFFEAFKTVMVCVNAQDAMRWLYELPLFLCSIQLITIPLAALTRGRVKESALDFVLIFGLLGAVLGTYGAGQNYAAYPVLSFDNVVSAITHAISGFSALYIAVSGMASLKKKNIPITFAIILGFCGAAYIADVSLDYNYMFLMRGDGTPYDLLMSAVGGNQTAYTVGVILLFLVYIMLFYSVYYLIKGRKKA